MINPFNQFPQPPQFGLQPFSPQPRVPPVTPAPAPQTAEPALAGANFNSLGSFANDLLYNPMVQIGLGILSANEYSPLAAISRGTLSGLNTVERLKRNKINNDIRLAELKLKQNPQGAALKPTAEMMNIMAATGAPIGSPEFQAAMTRRMFRPAGGNTTVKVNLPGAGPNAIESLPNFGGWQDQKKGKYYIIDPVTGEASVAQIPGAGAVTDAQRKTAGTLEQLVPIHQRMTEHENRVVQRQQQPGAGGVRDSVDRAVLQSATGPVSTAAANILTTPESQAYDADASMFASSYVFDKSGAASTNVERKDAMDRLTYGPFASPERIQRVQALRESVINDMVKRSENTITPERIRELESEVQSVSSAKAPPKPVSAPTSSSDYAKSVLGITN